MWGAIIPSNEANPDSNQSGSSLAALTGCRTSLALRGRWNRPVDGTIRWTSVITMRWPRYPADHQSCWLQRAADERLTVRGVGAQTWIALIRRGWLSVRSRMDRVFWPHRPAGWPPVGDVTPRVAVDAPSA